MPRWLRIPAALVAIVAMASAIAVAIPASTVDQPFSGVRIFSYFSER